MTNNKHRVDRFIDFFDRRAADYDRQYTDETPAGYALRVRRRKVLKLFDRPGGDVLDVGCGPGVIAAEMRALGCRFWGIDPAASMLSMANERFGSDPGVRFLQGVAGRLPFTDNCFDAVLCMGVIDSVHDGPQAVGEMIRVMKPGGTLIMTIANMISPYAWWKNFVYYPLIGLWHRSRTRIGDPSIDVNRTRSCPLRRMHSRPSATAIIEAAGARVVDAAPYNFNVFLSPLDELAPRTALRVIRSMEEGTWRWPEWIAAGWILKARKP